MCNICILYFAIINYTHFSFTLFALSLEYLYAIMQYLNALILFYPLHFSQIFVVQHCMYIVHCKVFMQHFNIHYMVLQPYKFSTLSIFQYLCSRFGMKIAKCGGVGKTINYFYPWSRDYSSRGDGRNPFAGITNSNNFISSHFLNPSNIFGCI